MKTLTQLLSELLENYDKEADREFASRHIYLRLFIPLIIIALLSYLVLALLRSETLVTVTIGIGIVVMGVAYYLNTKRKQAIIASYLLDILLGLMLLAHLWVTKGDYPKFLLVIYPIISLPVLRRNEGILLNSIFFVSTAAILLYFAQHHGMDMFDNFWYLIGYPATMLLVHFINVFNQSAIKRYEKIYYDAQKSANEKNEFISKLSHQIRTPLNNILAITSLLNESELTKSQQQMLDTIQASASNLVGVANSIKEAKIQKTQVAEDDVFLSFNLPTTIRTTIELFETTYKGLVKFRYNYSNNLPDKVKGNPIKVKQIFLNLIESLLASSDDLNGRHVDIEVAQKEEEASLLTCQISIESNTEIKLPPEVQNRHPDSMIEVNQNQEFFANLRDLNLIDLSLTNDIINSMNGRFHIRNHSGSTHYLVQIQLRKQAKQKKEQDTGKAQKQPQAASHTVVAPAAQQLSEAHILLAEDNRINQKIMRLSLQKYVKKIDFADNGKEALDMFGSTRYDIILMDVQMPVMDGIKTTQKMREIEQSTGSHTPIVAITANALLGDRETCLAAGMDDYVAKPFQIEKLVGLLEHHLKNLNDER